MTTDTKNKPESNPEHSRSTEKRLQSKLETVCKEYEAAGILLVVRENGEMHMMVDTRQCKDPMILAQLNILLDSSKNILLSTFFESEGIDEDDFE